MASHKRKLNVLPIEEKIKILDFLDKNPLLKKGDVAKKFDIPASTLSTIIKNRNSLVTSNKNAKKIRKCTFEELDECLTVWFEQCREQRIPVSGVMLQEKATEFAKKLGYDNFKASNGWLESFKCRKGIVFRKICGESAAVPQNVCDKWVEDELPSLTKNFDPVDIFNADETGLFYQCLPNKTAVFKGEECRGGKQSKIRVTVLLGANQDGSEKLPPLMIGRSAKPRCFKSVKSFPIAYESNRKAWMTSELFGQWLKKIDRSMGSKNRKILLFIDNCKAHSKLPLLKNISVEFLPANTTSKLQPLDQGVIRSFKVYYRKELIRKLLNSIDEKKTLPKINVLDAMRMIDYAWRNVSEKTIKNGFIQAGFKKMTEEPENGQETEDIDIELQEEDWMEFRKMLEDVSFEEFVNVDDAVATCGVLTEEEIINEVRGDSGEDDDETEHIDVPKVSAKDAENAIQTIRNFLESQEGVGEDGFSAIAKLRRIVSEKKNVRHQTLLTDFLQ